MNNKIFLNKEKTVYIIIEEREQKTVALIEGIGKIGDGTIFSMILKEKKTIDTIVFNNNKVKLPDNSRHLFSNLEIDIEFCTDFDVSNVTIMGSMFESSKIPKLNLNSWNVKNVETMDNMFAMAEIDLLEINNFNIQNVKWLDDMFIRTKIKNLNLNNWDISKIEGMKAMFSDAIIKNLNLSNWNMETIFNKNPNAFRHIFSSAQIDNLNLSNWKLMNLEKNVASIEMFLNAEIKSINLYGWEKHNIDFIKKHPSIKSYGTEIIESANDNYSLVNS